MKTLIFLLSGVYIYLYFLFFFYYYYDFIRACAAVLAEIITGNRWQSFKKINYELTTIFRPNLFLLVFFFPLFFITLLIFTGGILLFRKRRNK